MAEIIQDAQALVSGLKPFENKLFMHVAFLVECQMLLKRL